VTTEKNVTGFRALDELTTAYQALLPDPNQRVIVYCRTGHQASQTYFVLVHLLGYRNVQWYDAGWTEWAAYSELPAEVKKTQHL
jgi:thiosulfate/3-mercaptopyruvate sulfurtransferase